MCGKRISVACNIKKNKQIAFDFNFIEKGKNVIVQVPGAGMSNPRVTYAAQLEVLCGSV